MTRPAPSSTTDLFTRIVSLSTQYSLGLVGVPSAAVRLTWRTESSDPAGRQTAYEIESAADPEFATAVATTGKIESSNSIGVDAAGDALRSRELRYYRARIATPTGWTAWSPTASVEVGLTESADWSATAIGIESTVGGPSPLVRREFSINGTPRRARLYVTSLGLNEVEVNGQKLGNEYLAPGWTAYQGRLLVTTYDVTSALTAGENALGVTLADGWFRGRLGWEERDSIYGAELAALAQLEIELEDGRVQTVTTDDQWRGSFGAVRSSGIYDGTDIDSTQETAGWSSPGFDDSDWHGVHSVPLDLESLDLPIAPPVRIIGTFPMDVLPAADRVILDAQQNIAGWVRLVVRGKRGDTVVVRHAEVLEPDGTLHTRSLRSARAADHYVLGHDGESTLEPRFTFHGFRYADVVTTAEFVSATGIAISSDTTVRGRFESAEPALNRLHSNVFWSQRDNFVSVPTDCPQRDERLGWTGDAQAFSMTANTLFDTESFWTSWLVDLELDQAADGGVAAVVPNILTPDAFGIDDEPMNIMGRAGWADAATIVPMSLYESFGTTATLRRQLSSMRRWVRYLDSRRGGADLLPTEFQFGDWLDPDAPGSAPWAAKVSADFVSNSFFAHSARLLARAERLVGDSAAAVRADALADEVAASTWKRWGAEVVSTQTGCAIAIEFSIAPTDEHASIADSLAALVRAENGRIATGFLGTPLVLPALSRFGKFEEAYLMLLRREMPSWLYQVEMGATTVWERWDALRPDGSIHPGNMENSEGAHMLSFNHYAYGAVLDWIYRNLAGLAPTIDEPGYRRVSVAPRPVAGIPWVRASIATGFGELSIDWAVTADALTIDLTVPFGAHATVSPPVTAGSRVDVNGSPATEGIELAHGTHRITVTEPLVVAHDR